MLPLPTRPENLLLVVCFAPLTSIVSSVRAGKSVQPISDFPACPIFPYIYRCFCSFCLLCSRTFCCLREIFLAHQTASRTTFSRTRPRLLDPAKDKWTRRRGQDKDKPSGPEQSHSLLSALWCRLYPGVTRTQLVRPPGCRTRSGQGRRADRPAEEQIDQLRSRA